MPPPPSGPKTASVPNRPARLPPAPPLRPAGPRGLELPAPRGAARQPGRAAPVHVPPDVVAAGLHRDAATPGVPGTPLFDDHPVPPGIIFF